MRLGIRCAGVQRDLLASEPLVTRRQRLERLMNNVKGGGPIRLSETIHNAERLLVACEGGGLEGASDVLRLTSEARPTAGSK